MIMDEEMDEKQIPNPFEDNASKYESFLYQQISSLAGYLFLTSQRLDELEKAVKHHERSHNVASAQAMRMPTTAAEEKVS